MEYGKNDDISNKMRSRPNPYRFPTHTNILFITLLITIVISLLSFMLQYHQIGGTSLDFILLAVISMLVFPFSHLLYKGFMKREIASLPAGQPGFKSMHRIEEILRKEIPRGRIEPRLTIRPGIRILGSRQRSILEIPENTDEITERLERETDLKQAKILDFIIYHELSHYRDHDQWKLGFYENTARLLLLFYTLSTGFIIALSLFSVIAPLANESPLRNAAEVAIIFLRFPIFGIGFLMMAKLLCEIRESESNGWAAIRTGISDGVADNLTKGYCTLSRLLRKHDPILPISSIWNAVEKFTDFLSPYSEKSERSEGGVLKPNWRVSVLVGFVGVIPVGLYLQVLPSMFWLIPQYLAFSIWLPIIVLLSVYLTVVMSPFFEIGLIFSDRPEDGQSRGVIVTLSTMLSLGSGIFLGFLPLIAADQLMSSPIIDGSAVLFAVIASPLISIWGSREISIGIRILLADRLSISKPQILSEREIRRIVMKARFVVIVVLLAILSPFALVLLPTVLINFYSLGVYLILLLMLSIYLGCAFDLINFGMKKLEKASYCNSCGRKMYPKAADRKIVSNIWDTCPFCEALFYRALFVEVED